MSNTTGRNLILAPALTLTLTLNLNLKSKPTSSPTFLPSCYFSAGSANEVSRVSQVYVEYVMGDCLLVIFLPYCSVQ